jgi:hypothetical protein
VTVNGPLEGEKECIVVPGAILGPPPPTVPGAGVDAVVGGSAAVLDGPAWEAAVDAFRGRPARVMGGPVAAILEVYPIGKTG